MKKSLLVITAIILALGLGEIILRANPDIRQRLGEVTPYDFNCFKTGTYYWVDYQESKACTLRSPGGAFPDVTININALGTRGQEVAKEKLSGTTRLLFVGDSFTAGWGVEEGNTFPEIIGARLRTQFPDKQFEVINAGMTAAGPTYYYLYLLHEGLRLNPDIVIVGLYLYNDIDGIMHSTWHTDTNGLPIRATSDLFFVTSDGYLSRTHAPLTATYPLLKRFYLAHVFTDWLFSWQQQKQPVGFLPKLCLFQGSQAKECAKLVEANEKTKRLFVAMKEIVEKIDARLVVVMIPAEVQVYQGVRQKYGIVVPLSPDDKARPNNEYTQFFSEHNIESVDLLPAFRQFTGDNPYYTNDDHWNTRGHAIAGDAITKWLMENHIQ